MKSNLHPEYRYVVFRDISNNTEFLTRSAIHARNFKGTTTIDGQEYPVVLVDISATSHPFFTGQQKLMDAEGRVEKFNRKYGLNA